MTDGVDEVEQLPGAFMVSLGGEGHDRPDGGVGVLTAIFTNSRNIAFDVAGIHCGFVEGGVEELDKVVFSADEASIDGVHGGAGTEGVARAGED